MEKLASILKRLEEVPENQLIDTGKAIPEHMKKIYQDIIEVFAGIQEQKKELDEKIIGIQEEKELKFQEKIWLAGGSLSELFIEGYAGKAKDIDIFIDSKLLERLFERNEYRRSKVEIDKALVAILNEEVGRFESRTETEAEDDGYSSFMKNHHIISGFHKDFPGFPLEIIITDAPKLNFDLAFREFYYFGNNILATGRALEDIKERKITVNNLNSPTATWVRLREFAKRYNYRIDGFSKKWLMKNICYMASNDWEQAEECLMKVKKYRKEEDIEEFKKEFIQETPSPEEEGITRYLYFELESGYTKEFRDIIERLRKIEEEKIDVGLVERVETVEIEPLNQSFVKNGVKYQVEEAFKVELIEKIEKIEKREKQRMKLRRAFANEVNTSHIDEAFGRELEKKMAEYGLSTLLTDTMVYTNFYLDCIIEGRELPDSLVVSARLKEYYGEEEEEVRKKARSKEIFFRFPLHTILERTQDVIALKVAYGKGEEDFKNGGGIVFLREMEKIKIEVGSFAYLANKRFKDIEEKTKQAFKDIKIKNEFRYEFEELAERIEKIDFKARKLTEPSIDLIRSIKLLNVRPIAEDPFETWEYDDDKNLPF